MPSNMKRFSFLPLVAALSAVACAQAGSSDSGELAADISEKAGKHVTEHHASTVKPGAAIEMSHTYEGPINAGEQGYVDLIIREAYDAGTMTLEANTDEGLSVFGSSVSKTFQLDGANEHTWRINFGAVEDGIQYLRVRANAEPDGLPSSARSYAVRINVGNVSAAEAEKSKKITTTPDGEAVIIMEAEETTE